MHIKAAGVIVILLFIFMSCGEEDITVVPQELQTLEGYWVNQQFSDSLQTYVKSDKLVANQYGFAFLPNGKFIERKNAGWCGTPPISYSDFDGSWMLTDSVVNVSVGYWGGTAAYRWQIVFVNNQRLTIEVISQDYSQEN